jgi:hypothetical protein
VFNKRFLIALFGLAKATRALRLTASASPHYRIVRVAPVVDAALVLGIDFIMTSITELDVQRDKIDGFLILSGKDIALPKPS